jgi:hypothetical protein
VDHGRPLWPVHHHQLEEVPGPVRTEYEIADRIIGDLLHDQGVADGVLDGELLIRRVCRRVVTALVILVELRVRLSASCVVARPFAPWCGQIAAIER